MQERERERERGAAEDECVCSETKILMEMFRCARRLSAGLGLDEQERIELRVSDK